MQRFYDATDTNQRLRECIERFYDVTESVCRGSMMPLRLTESVCRGSMMPLRLS